MLFWVLLCGCVGFYRNTGAKNALGVDVQVGEGWVYDCSYGGVQDV